MDEDEFNSLFDSSDDQTEEQIVEEETVAEVADAADDTVEEETNTTAETPTEEAPVDEEKGRHHVPVTALLDERDKRKEAQKRAEELERRIAEYEARSEQRVETPDPYVDPDKYHEFLQSEIQRQVTAHKIELSLTWAKEKHGEDDVNAAIQWAREKAQSDPSFDAQITHQTSPIEWAVRQHKRHVEMSEFERDPDAFVLRRAAELQARNSAAASTVIPTATAANTTDGVAKNKAPKSLASAPAATRQEKPLNDDEDFNSIFRK